METLAAAEDLSKQKHELERELEKVEVEVAFRERAVADEHQIAEALRQFDDELKELSFEEQCELVRQIVRGIQGEPPRSRNGADSGRIKLGGEENTNSLVFDQSRPSHKQLTIYNFCRPSGLSSHFVKDGRAGEI